jgi:L-amino acid N-acyltransferase YncA
VRETAISFELEPPTAREIRRRIRESGVKTPWLVIVDGSRVKGYAYASPFRGRPAYRFTVEVTVYVDAAHRGQGVARALYGSLLEALRADGYRRAVAGIALPNPASVALHESFGFAPVGVFRKVGWKLGRWHDVGFWQLDLPRVRKQPGRRR